MGGQERLKSGREMQRHIRRVGEELLNVNKVF